MENIIFVGTYLKHLGKYDAVIASYWNPRQPNEWRGSGIAFIL